MDHKLRPLNAAKILVLEQRPLSSPRQLFHPLAGAEFGVARAFLASVGGFQLPHLTPLIVSRVATRLRRPWIEKTAAQVAALPEDWHRTNPPVFILGFWRSGTTLLHELLATNRRFAAPSTIDVLFPADAPCLLRWKRRLVGALLPPTRGMDHVAVTPSSPQEEELAIANLGGPSFFSAFYVSASYDHAVDEAMFFDDAPARREEWRTTHAFFLKALTVKYRDRTLLLKNPANSTRIPDLLELYPDALFIRIDRPREDVIPSFLRMQEQSDAWFGLENRLGTRSRFGGRRREDAEAFHARVTAKLDRDWNLIRPERRATVRYAGVVGRPLHAILSIYRDLGLDFDPEARRRCKRYWTRIAKARSPERDLIRFARRRKTAPAAGRSAHDRPDQGTERSVLLARHAAAPVGDDQALGLAPAVPPRLAEQSLEHGVLGRRPEEA